MRFIRHSSVSALPVETAMSGMLSFGLTPVPLSVPGRNAILSGTFVLLHEFIDVSTVM